MSPGIIIPPAPLPRVKRRDFVLQVLRQMRLPYMWNGKGYSPLEAKRLGVPPPPYDGRDCSGTAAYAYRAAGGAEVRGKANAEWMFEQLASVGIARSGTLYIFGDSADSADAAPAHADHVMMYVDPGLLVGAEGGGPGTTSITVALNAGAKVWVEVADTYMPARLLGLREFPFED